MKPLQKRIFLGVASSLAICAVLYAVLRRPGADEDVAGPGADFLLSSVEGLELGMARETLLKLRDDAIFDGAADPGDNDSPLLYEEFETKEQTRRILYFVAGTPSVLEKVTYIDSYPTEILDERIERKLRSATKRWGEPLSLFAEMQRPSGEYFGAVWKIAPETLMTISYVPLGARRENRKGGYPVITRFLPGTSEKLPVTAIEPESFDLAVERAGFNSRIRKWGQ